MYVPCADDVEGARDVMVDADHVHGPCVLTPLLTGGCARQGVGIPLARIARPSWTDDDDDEARQREREWHIQSIPH